MDGWRPAECLHSGATGLTVEEREDVSVTSALDDKAQSGQSGRT